MSEDYRQKGCYKNGMQWNTVKNRLHWNTFSASEWACFSSLFSTCFIVFTNKKLFLETLTCVLKYLKLTRPTTACYTSKRHGVKVGPGPRDPGPQDPPQSLKMGPETPLKFTCGTPGPSSKFKSGVPGPPTKFKSGTRSSFLNEFTFFQNISSLFFTYLFFCLF